MQCKSAMNLKKLISSTNARAKGRFHLSLAKGWQKLHRAEYWLKQKFREHKGKAVLFILFILVCASLSPSIQIDLEAYYTEQSRIQDLKNVLLTIGATLLGATAIIIAIVLFTLQLNIKRLPYGLFRRLSHDRKLLSFFAITFILAIGMNILSNFTKQEYLAYVVIYAMWAIVLILLLFWFAYRRALDLISPVRQLDILTRNICKNLERCVRHAKRVSPLLDPKETGIADPQLDYSTHDLHRMMYFRINPHWVNSAKQGIRYAMSISQNYAERRDYEVSKIALNSVVEINDAYINAKGKTFQTDTQLIANPLSRDAFISETLNTVQINLGIEYSRKDEQQISLLLQLLAKLVQSYLRIDYSVPNENKSHANLAAGYIVRAALTLKDHNMPNALLTGVQLIGVSARCFVKPEMPDETQVLSQQISRIACCCINKKYYEVAYESITQLKDLTLEMFYCKWDIRSTVGSVSQSIYQIAQMLIKTFDSNSFSNLGSYYSLTNDENNLLCELTKLTNCLHTEQVDNANTRYIIENICQWSGQHSETVNQLLLTAIETKSKFTFDMIQWSTHVMEILLVISNLPACKSVTQVKLQKHGLMLVKTLINVPDDNDSITFVENHCQLTEALFKSAMKAQEHNCVDISKKIGHYLFSWIFKASSYIDLKEREVIEVGLCACVALALEGDDGDIKALKSKIHNLRQSKIAPNQEILEHAAGNIRLGAKDLTNYGHGSNEFLYIISQLDYKRIASQLIEIADIILPPGQMNNELG